MRESLRRWLAEGRQKLQTGEFQKRDFDRLESLLREPCQLILYLYAKSSDPGSPVVSWSLRDPTHPVEPTLPDAEPPYESVTAAMVDGWRVVQFPISKLYRYQEQDNDYLGFEFILEKIA